NVGDHVCQCIMKIDDCKHDSHQSTEENSRYAGGIYPDECSKSKADGDKHCSHGFHKPDVFFWAGCRNKTFNMNKRPNTRNERIDALYNEERTKRFCGLEPH